MKNTSPLTFQTSDHIDAAKYPIIMAPFFGAMVPFKLKRLSLIEKAACGNFSTVETVEDKANMGMARKISVREMEEYSEFHHNILRHSMVEPTYDELIKLCSDDFESKKAQEELNAALKKLDSLPTQKEKNELQEEIHKLKIWINYILPDDFIAAVLNFALGRENLHVEFTRKMFLDAAVLAERGGDNPIDHIDPENNLSTILRDDINRKAWYYLAQEKENAKDAN